MNGEFINALADRLVEPKVMDVNGEQRLVLPPNWQEKSRPAKPEPHVLSLSTLAGLALYLRENRDGLTLSSIVVHVESPHLVTVCDRLEDESALYRRKTYAKVDLAKLYEPLPAFGQFMNVEAFTIMLQTRFVQTEVRDQVIVLLASIREGTVRETVDNGYAQEVTSKAGVALVDSTKVSNPVVLQPFRTFREVEQPESPFILRLQSGEDRPKAALFEADGGAWKLEAIRRTADWLAKALQKKTEITRADSSAPTFVPAEGTIVSILA
jgi:hypothetical protein